FHVSLFPLLIILLMLLAMPPHPQKKNDAGPAGLRPAGPASFFFWGWGGMASNISKIIRRGKSDT
ncbi:MAG TPA: hypothetical protein VHD63_20575, partial [Ktedonobacteraceae bacterium]|nr:hypothetical protein [Ktedonobacteraceae bacterium]